METGTDQPNLPNPQNQKLNPLQPGADQTGADQTGDDQTGDDQTGADPTGADLSASLQAIIHTAWSGPLPPPSQLREYEQAHPGLTERIVVVFEKQFEQRHSMELRVLKLEAKQMRLGFDQRRRGQYLAFVICLAAIIGGTYVGSRGQQIVGSIIGGTGLAGLAAAFIYGQAAGAKKDKP